MTEYKNQNWRRYAATALFIAGPPLVRKLAKKLKPKFEEAKARLEDYLDKKNHNIETNYQKHGFSIEMPYVKSDGAMLIKYVYEDKLTGTWETLSLTKEYKDEDLEAVLVRDRKKEVKVARLDREGMILEEDDDPKERFEDIYTGANLEKYEQRWKLRNVNK